MGCLSLLPNRVATASLFSNFDAFYSLAVAIKPVALKSMNGFANLNLHKRLKYAPRRVPLLVRVSAGSGRDRSGPRAPYPRLHRIWHLLTNRVTFKYLVPPDRAAAAEQQYPRRPRRYPTHKVSWPPSIGYHKRGSNPGLAWLEGETTGGRE
jgi:hypothetical protein